MNKKIAIILGTRPEIIKMSPIIRLCEKKKLDYFILHTGQHYSYEMDKAFFEELELPQPKYNLNVGSGIYGKQLGLMINGVYEKLALEKPDVVLVLGDTNTTLAGALGAYRLDIKIGHIESGLRTYELMYEEINRVIIGIHSTYLFAPNEDAKNNLIRECIPEEKIFVTGNTIVDAVQQNIEVSKKRSNIIKNMKLENGKYFLITTHRAESVDSKERLSEILEGMRLVHKEFGVPIVFPIHPRTKNNMDKMGLKIPEGVVVIGPVGYLDFLQLIMNAKAVITDSGGIQEETCILKVPCITIREFTERGETVKIGANMIAGYDSKKILDYTKKMVVQPRTWGNPFGDGKAAERIIGTLLSR